MITCGSVTPRVGLGVVAVREQLGRSALGAAAGEDAAHTGRGPAPSIPAVIATISASNFVAEGYMSRWSTLAWAKSPNAS